MGSVRVLEEEGSPDDDPSLQSTKKVKTKECVCMEGVVSEGGMKDDDTNVVLSNQSKSYKESLLTSDGGKIFTDFNSLIKEMENPEDAVYHEKEVVRDESELDPCPKIYVTQEEFEEWCAPWKNSLVIQVLGKRVAFRMLDNKVQREWARTGVVRLIDMSEDHYLVQFTSEEDYKHALFEGSWLIEDHYIVVQIWKPFFMVTAKQTRKIATWIRLPKLPIELFNDRFLWRVGNKLGTMLKIDKLTLGSFP
ncbi:uncharacterized protein LOC109800506 [Cajanus cajan]|nr:uncharacterized protein LOC109800506 [Cajanus cajan]